jgi:hypothetical protein
MNADSYLAKPTGVHGIGHTDYHFINTNINAKLFSEEQNKCYFSPENKNFNREIMVRIYYPTDNIIKLGSLYYQPLTQMLKNMVQLNLDIKLTDAQDLDTLKSFSHKDTAIHCGQKFPVVLFSHGMNQCVQFYENVITNLVSNGYIVVGVNSLFIGGHIQIPNGQVVNMLKHEHGKGIDDLIDKVTPYQESDISYVISQLHLLQHMDTPVFSSMDLHNIGGMRHSLGATAIANLARRTPDLFKAAVGQDSDFNPHSQEVQPFLIPFLHLLSGNRYINIPWWEKQFKPIFKLNKHNFLVGIAPSNELLKKETGPFYSLHSEFSDWSTLKNMNILKKCSVAIEQKHGWPLFGYGPSDEIVNSINTPIVRFFNTYLKRQSSNLLMEEHSPLTDNSLIVAGPTTF